jgi:phage shock protein A
MSVSQVYIIDELKQKIQLLADKLERHKSAATALHSQKTDLEDRIREQEKEINDLKKQNNTLKLTRAFVAENNEPQEAKLQINKIVREIDKCIALLNR